MHASKPPLVSEVIVAKTIKRSSVFLAAKKDQIVASTDLPAYSDTGYSDTE